MNQLITQKIIVLLLGEAFRPPLRNEPGKMVLRKSNQLFIILLVLFAVTLAAMYFVMSVPEETLGESTVIIQILSVGLALYLIFILDYLTFQVNVSGNIIVVKSFGISKSMNFSEINNVGYTRFFGGRVLIKGTRQTLRIPENMRGVAELVDYLSASIGPDRCMAAKNQLAKKKEELARWNR